MAPTWIVEFALSESTLDNATQDTIGQDRIAYDEIRWIGQVRLAATTEHRKLNLRFGDGVMLLLMLENSYLHGLEAE